MVVGAVIIGGLSSISRIEIDKDKLEVLLDKSVAIIETENEFLVSKSVAALNESSPEEFIDKAAASEPERDQETDSSAVKV